MSGVLGAPVATPLLLVYLIFSLRLCNVPHKNENENENEKKNENER